MRARISLCALAVTCLWAGSARAATYPVCDWALTWDEPVADTVLEYDGRGVTGKAMEFVVHDDGNLYAISWEKATGTKTIWSFPLALANDAWTSHCVLTPANPATPTVLNEQSRNATTEISVATTPQLVSFNGALYTTQGYELMTYANDAGGDDRKYKAAELCVLQIDDSAVDTYEPVLMVRSKKEKKDQFGSHWTFSVGAGTFAEIPLTDGYLFVDGGKIVWGGGGGKSVSIGASEMLSTGTYGGAGFADGGNRPNNYVYSSADGAAWSLLKRQVKDQYGTAIGLAMPNGYRYNHIIAFDSVLWDYYGYYTPGTIAFAGMAKGGYTEFAFTPKTDGVHTEPYGRFQMGTDGTTLYRVGFTKAGTANSLYSITGTGGTWTDLGNPDPGDVYLRNIAVLSGNTDAAHDGVYCVYSRNNGGAYSSGVWRYDGGWDANPITSTDDLPSGMTATAGLEACDFTGGIIAIPDNGIYVGTTKGVVSRGTNTVEGAPAFP